MDWKKESEMFNQTANYYDRFRPSYPHNIIDTVIAKTNISNTARVLEIGAGSGKATESFVNKGFNILCIDSGADLVKIGRDKFSQNKNVSFEVVRFEEYKADPQYFDVIFSAQAFHWVSQPIGFKKCAYALKSKGYLALFWNMYITYDNEIDNELLTISDKYGGFADYLSESECENRIISIISQIEDSHLFASPKVYRSLWKQKYTAEEYYGFALTGNRFVQKTDEEKQEAYKELTHLFNKHNGIIERPYLCVLYLAQKKI